MACASNPKRPRTRRSLPLDLLLEIAARTEPATLVRCAAACKELRRHIADPVFHGRIRLHLRRGERFVPSLLRGCLVSRYRYDLDLVLVDNNTTAEATTKLLCAAACTCFPPVAAAVKSCRPLAARDGLILLRGKIDWDHDLKLCVCCPATGRCQALPPAPEPGCYYHYVHLVGGEGGGAAVGRPFQVLKVRFVTSDGTCYLQIDSFSSEQGAWAPRVRVSHPLFNSGGHNILTRPWNSVVIGDTVHWLHCQGRNRRTMFHILKLHVGTVPRVTVAELPESFHSTCRSLSWKTWQILLVTSPVDRNLTVLVANNDMISAWVQSDPERTGRWTFQPELIKDCGAMNLSLGKMVQLEWFAERSGVVLVVASDDNSSSFLLDLQSKNIKKSSLSPTIVSGGTFPYEMDVSSWAPTFTKIF